MFPEFGQAPLCLELDLDSYEGSWTHIAAFRGRSGWLMAARATIQSERDLMRRVLLVGCDEYETPIPAWRAEHLTACDWSNLHDCRELPPDLLDDLLCEEEGAFFAMWQRETNAELVALHDQAQHDLAAVDARLSAIQRQADAEILDLQRRRRHPDASPDHRAALRHLIARIEFESDAAVVDATARRAALRREIDAAEEALWDRSDVLIEVEPMWCVQWQAAAKRVLSRSVSYSGTGGMRGSLSTAEQARGRLARAMRAGGGCTPANAAAVRLPSLSDDAGKSGLTMATLSEQQASLDVSASTATCSQMSPNVPAIRLKSRERAERLSRIAMFGRTAVDAGGHAPEALSVTPRPLPAGAAYALEQYRRDRARAVRVDAEAVAELAQHREGTPQHTQRIVAIARRRERIAKLDLRIADLERRMAVPAAETNSAHRAKVVE